MDLGVPNLQVPPPETVDFQPPHGPLGDDAGRESGGRGRYSLHSFRYPWSCCLRTIADKTLAIRVGVDRLDGVALAVRATRQERGIE